MKRIFTALIAFVALALTAQAQDKVYWVQSKWQGQAGFPTFIGSVNFDETNQKSITTTYGDCYDIEIDFYKGIMYWGEAGRGVSKANIDGSGLQRMVTFTNGYIGGVALDLKSNKLYYTYSTGQDAAKLGSMNTDGTNKQTDLWTITGEVSTLTYLPEFDKLYFTSYYSGTSKVQRCNTDGTNIETLLTISGFVPGLAIDQKMGKMYLSYWDSNEVRVTDFFNPTTPTLLFANSNGTFQMCVSNTENKLYFAETSTKKIRKCNLDGSSPQDIITVTNSPMALAIPTIPPTPTILEDRTYEFMLSNLIFTGIDRNTLTKVQIQTGVDKGELYLDANSNNIVDAGEAVIAGTEITKADIEAGKLKFNPTLEESGAPYTQFTYKWHKGSEYSTQTFTITITVLPEPILAGGSTTAMRYFKTLPAEAIQPNITIADLKDTDANSAVIKFKSGYVTGQDVLDYTGNAAITQSWDAATGTLTLTGVATLANYQEILSQVFYKNIGAIPTSGTRVVSMTLYDNGKASNEINRNIIIADLAGDINNDGLITDPEIAGDVNEDGNIVSPEIVGDLNGDGWIIMPEIAGDKNGDGKITAPEVAGDLNGDGNIVSPEKAGDLNGNGLINSPEIAGDTNGDDKISSPEIAGDVNGDGTITLPEIAGDTNGNGIITAPEIAGDKNGNGVLDGDELPTTVQLSKQVNAMVVSAYGQIFILNPSADDVANVQVIDMTGKKVVSFNHMSVPLGKTQIESGTLAKGIYSVVVKGKKLDVIAKIVVK